MSAQDLQALFYAQSETRRWRAESENAGARLQLARADEARAFLLSQHEPVASLGMDRKALRILLSFTVHGDTKRMRREVDEHLQAKAATVPAA